MQLSTFAFDRITKLPSKINHPIETSSDTLTLNLTEFSTQHVQNEKYELLSIIEHVGKNMQQTHYKSSTSSNFEWDLERLSLPSVEL